MDNEYLKRIYGLLESGATLGTGAVSGLVGMPYGLYKGVTSGAYGTPQAPKIAAREAQQFMERNTYQPRSAEGQDNLRQLAGLLESSKLPPVMPELSLLAAIPKQAYAAQAERTGMAAERALAPVVTRTMERGGLPAQLLGDLAQGSIRPMDVWHGSPYGPFQKFDPSKARTGEGNATFGEGAYLAQARGTGETYRDVLSAGKQTEGLLNSDKMSDKIAANTLQMYKTPSKAIDALESGLTPNLTGEARQATNDAIDVLKGIDKNAGYLYKVDLPDESIAKMLDYDKPLSKQAPEVQAALAELGISVDKKKLGEYEDALLDALTNPNATGQLPKQPLDLTGEQILKEIERNASRYFPNAMEGKELTGAMINPRAGVSELLSKKGVTGVRYLDQMSRDAGDGTSNFVVFPKYQDLLTIKEINDKPIGGLLGQSKAASASSLSDIENKFNDIALDVYEKNGTINLSRIVVPKEMRSSGIGSSAMNDLTSYADQTGQKMALTPSDDFGGNVKRLKDFYKQFGFVENKGKNKDFSTMETMIRLPDIRKEPKEITNLLD